MEAACLLAPPVLSHVVYGKTFWLLVKFSKQSQAMWLISLRNTDSLGNHCDSSCSHIQNYCLSSHSDSVQIHFPKFTQKREDHICLWCVGNGNRTFKTESLSYSCLHSTLAPLEEDDSRHEPVTSITCHHCSSGHLVKWNTFLVEFSTVNMVMSIFSRFT